MTTVQDVMTSDIVTVEPDASIQDAARRMRDSDIGNVLILEGDHLSGIVTDRDLTIRAVADGMDPTSTAVREVCSADLVTVEASDDIHVAAEKMREHAVRRIPVVDGGRPVGVLSIGDLAMELDPHEALSEISAAPPQG